MNIRKICYGAAFGFVLLMGFANAQTPMPANIEQHLRAAREAAKFEWVWTLSRNCVAPELGPPEIGERGAIPDRSLWYARPAKVFDNLYFVGTRIHSSWALTTSDGIILIDTLYN
jgi:metallo-beta-lactamase class B